MYLFNLFIHSFTQKTCMGKLPCAELPGFRDAHPPGARSRALGGRRGSPLGPARVGAEAHQGRERASSSRRQNKESKRHTEGRCPGQREQQDQRCGPGRGKRPVWLEHKGEEQMLETKPVGRSGGWGGGATPLTLQAPWAALRVPP